MKRSLIPVLALPILAACSIMDKSDTFGASVDIGVGGIIGYIADLHFKANVGFSKTCPEPEQKEGVHGASQGDGFERDSIGHFL